jgi:hypothetical protein
MDRDGTDDLVAIHSHHELDGKGVGGVYIFYGSKAAGETALRASRVARLTIQQEYPGQAHAWHGYFTPNFASGTWNRITGGLAGGYDINGDGAADLLVSSPFELTGPLATSTKYVDGGAGYVFYGISGGYKSVIGSGCEGGYPCSITLGNAAGNTPDYSPLKIIDNLDTSCSSGGCNVLRFHPPASYGAYTGLKFGGGILGMGDITGDAYGDVAVTTSAATVKRLFIYSGSATGLYVTPNPSLYPTCTDGMCTPYVAPLPTSGSGWVGNASEMFYGLQGFAGAGDIDGDGKRDFFISSPFIHEKNGVGFWTGGLLIFR